MVRLESASFAFLGVSFAELYFEFLMNPQVAVSVDQLRQRTKYKFRNRNNWKVLYIYGQLIHYTDKYFLRTLRGEQKLVPTLLHQNLSQR